MILFDVALQKTLSHEGGYSNDPLDTGGETYCGISRVHNPTWTGWAVIDKYKATRPMPENGRKFHESDLAISLRFHVSAFYKTLWDRLDLDTANSQELANELFDIMVNMGEGRAVKFLQEALNALNRNQALWPDLKVDGDFGPVTRKLFREQKDEHAAIEKVLIILRGAFYLEIVRKNPTQEAFIRGWLSRVRVG